MWQVFEVFFYNPIEFGLDFFLVQTGFLSIAILLLVFCIRVLLLPLYILFFKTLQAIQAAQEPIKEIQKKFEKDKQRQSQEIIAVYKQNNIKIRYVVLFFIVQIPIYIILFFVITDWQMIADESVITSIFSIDLTSKGNYLLTAIVVITQSMLLFISKKNADEKNAKIQKYTFYILLPVVGGISFFLGNVVAWYITTINCFAILQEVFVVKLFKKSERPK